MRKGAPRAERAVWISVAVLFVCFAANANAQDTQETPPDPCEKKAGCVKSDYDRFKDTITVGMTPVLLVPNNGYGNPLEGIQMGVMYSSPGTVVQRPDKALFFFGATDRYNTGAEPVAFRKSRDVDLLIDGVSRPLGGVEVLRRRLSESDIFFPTWTYSLEVPFDVVEKIAAAKRVEVRAGAVDTFLDEDTKAAFRRLVELVPKKESVPPLAKDKAAPRPKPTRPSRRRGRP
ncbi:MAG: hypothetical protein QOC99_743 [Acidobacteriota bacterium]|nr:hypothetical protein [Acidobacteriota bacterium]